MKTAKKLGTLLLSIWLILLAADFLLGLGYRHLHILNNILALVAGVLLLWSVLAEWKGPPAA